MTNKIPRFGSFNIEFEENTNRLDFQHFSDHCLLGTKLENHFFHSKWWRQSKIDFCDVFGMYLKPFWSVKSFEICSWQLWRRNCCFYLLGTQMDKTCLEKFHVMICCDIDAIFIPRHHDTILKRVKMICTT